MSLVVAPLGGRGIARRHHEVPTGLLTVEDDVQVAASVCLTGEQVAHVSHTPDREVLAGDDGFDLLRLDAVASDVLEVPLVPTYAADQHAATALLPSSEVYRAPRRARAGWEPWCTGPPPPSATASSEPAARVYVILTLPRLRKW